jgi:hypothetical protein
MARLGERHGISLAGLRAAEAAGDELGTIGMRIAHASTCAMNLHWDEALTEGSRALDDARRLRQPTLEASALFAYGEGHIGNEPARALELLREAWERADAIGDEQQEIATLNVLCFLEAEHGVLARSLSAIRRQMLYAASNPYRFAYFVCPQPFVRSGRLDLAAIAVRWCELQRARQGQLTLTPLHDSVLERGAAELRARFGDDAVTAELLRIAELPQDELTARVMTEIDAALAATDSDDGGV